MLCVFLIVPCFYTFFLASMMASMIQLSSSPSVFHMVLLPIIQFFTRHSGFFLIFSLVNTLTILLAHISSMKTLVKNSLEIPDNLGSGDAFAGPLSKFPCWYHIKNPTEFYFSDFAYNTISPGVWLSLEDEKDTLSNSLKFGNNKPMITTWCFSAPWWSLAMIHS